MNQNIIVRQMTIEDISRYMQEISNYIFESMRMANYEESYTREQSVEKTEALRSYFKENKAIVIGAFDELKMVGFLWAYMCPFRDDLNRIYISILHVMEGYRAHKIGTKLVTMVEEIAKNRNVDKIFLHAEASSQEACGFYESICFSKERIQYVKEINHSST